MFYTVFQTSIRFDKLLQRTLNCRCVRNEIIITAETNKKELDKTQGCKNIGTTVPLLLRKVWDLQEGVRSTGVLANQNSLYEFVSKIESHQLPTLWP